MKCCAGSVERLSLYLTFIHDEGMVHFPQFPDQILQKMRTLRLNACGIGQTGFDLLAETVPLLPSLKSLDICANKGGDGSAVKLFQALGKHSKLEQLLIGRTPIFTDDVVALCELVHSLKSFRKLSIGINEEMSPQCVQQLVRTVLSPSSVRELIITVCSH